MIIFFKYLTRFHIVTLYDILHALCYFHKWFIIEVAQGRYYMAMKVLFITQKNEDMQDAQRLIEAQTADVEVITVWGKQQAIDAAMTDGPFAFYLLDVEVKTDSPKEIAQDLIDLGGDRPFLFLGSEMMIKDRISQDLYAQNQYNDSLILPLTPDKISSQFGEILKWAKEEEYEQAIEEVTREDFIPMKIRYFFLFETFPYDIYLEVTATRFLKILSANSHYTLSQLHTFVKKGVKFLYVKKNDHLKYLEEEANFCLDNLFRANPKQEEFHMACLRSISILHQYIQNLGVAGPVEKLTDLLVNSLHNLGEKRFTFASYIKDFPGHYRGVASKSLLTCYVARALGVKEGWDSKTSFDKLYFSAIFMDLTLQDDSLTSINNLNTPEIDILTEEELENYKQHPIQAGMIARYFIRYPDCDYLIENHHERPDRKGFPNGVGHIKLTTMSAILNIAQYIAADLDGQKITNDLIFKTLKGMKRSYSAGNFREPMANATTALKLKSKN